MAISEVSVFGRVDAGGVEVVDGHGVLVVHAAEEDFAALAEAAGVAVAAVVPFACAESGVAVFSQQFWQQRDVIW